MRRIITLGLCILLASSAPLAASGLSLGEKQDLYKWMLRLRKDLEILDRAFSRERSRSDEALDESLIEHSKSGLNHWQLAPAHRRGLEAIAGCTEDYLKELDETRGGFAVDGKLERFSTMTGSVRKLTGKLEGDWVKPTPKERAKALEHLEDHLSSATKLADAILTSLRSSVPEALAIESSEGLRFDDRAMLDAVRSDAGSEEPNFDTLDQRVY